MSILTNQLFHNEWEVENGTIISGNGTSSIEVLWDVAESGTVSIVATNNDCSTGQVELDVSLSTSDFL